LTNIRQYFGDPKGARQLLDRSIAIDPHNFIIRENYMNALQTRWGGSVNEMKAFLNECQHAGLAAEKFKALEAKVFEDEAYVHRYVDGDSNAAVLDYKKAARLDPASSCLPCGPISQAADLLLQAKNYKDAVKLYSKVLALDSNSMHARNGLAYGELQLNRPKSAFKDFLYAADHGDAYAQDMLGRMYLLGTSIPQDHDRAIEWIQKAAAQGYPPAVELLPFALHKDAKALAIPGAPRL
jgi:TPR repeat protein